MASNSVGTNVANGGLGFQLGARLLLLETYLDHTRFGEGTSVTRGVLGVRGGFGNKDLRLVLRGGLGVVEEKGGALTGQSLAAPERQGGVARVGVAIETRLAPLLLAGFGIDGERFLLRDPVSGGTITGTDVFASLKVMFELGI